MVEIAPAQVADDSNLRNLRSRFRCHSRLIAYHSLSDYPLVVTVSSTVEYVLREWRQQSLYATVAALVAIAIILFGALLIGRQLRVTQALEGEVAESERRRLAAVAAADLNSDGWPELVVANREQQGKPDVNSYVYWGGRSGFDASRRSELPTHQANWTSVADLNADKLPDIVFANGSGAVSYIYLNGPQGFSAARRIELHLLQVRETELVHVGQRLAVVGRHPLPQGGRAVLRQGVGVDEDVVHAVVVARPICCPSRLTGTATRDAAAGADALLGSCNQAVIAAGTSLRWVQAYGAGVEDCLSTPTIRERGILLTNVQRVLARSATAQEMSVYTTFATGPRRAGDPAILFASSDRIKSELGWRPQYEDIATIVETAWRWRVAHPQGYEKEL